jgi:aspartate kinase
VRVQKYGGTSVGDLDRIRKVAARIQRAVEAGERVAVTVSAMGRTTDELIATARELQPRPDRRELDMLMATGEQVSIALLTMALQQLGVRARSFTGAQAGLPHRRPARRRAHPAGRSRAAVARLRGGRRLRDRRLPGRRRRGHITTLGRGGSDTTAVAVAAALGADTCEIYTDTDGVYTTDPHLIPSARKLEVVDYDVMLELAALGAKVLHPRSVWYGRRYGVHAARPLVVHFQPGTLVRRVARRRPTWRPIGP